VRGLPWKIASLYWMGVWIQEVGVGLQKFVECQHPYVCSVILILDACTVIGMINVCFCLCHLESLLSSCYLFQLHLHSACMLLCCVLMIGKLW